MQLNRSVVLCFLYHHDMFGFEKEGGGGEVGVTH